jgi:hypothetical protein
MSKKLERKVAVITGGNTTCLRARLDGSLAPPFLA